MSEIEAVALEAVMDAIESISEEQVANAAEAGNIELTVEELREAVQFARNYVYDL